LWELITTTYVPGTFTEYPLPAGSVPTQIVEGPDGNLWFTEQGRDNIGRITPTGTLTEFPIPNSNVMPFGITNGPDGNLWFTNFPAGTATVGAIGRITTAGVITLFSAEGLQVPLGITAGPDGNLWFVDAVSQAIGYCTTSGSIKEFALTSNPTSALRGITTGPDSNLWFTDFGDNKIGKITTGGKFMEYDTAAGSQPTGILARSGSLLFGEPGTANIGQSTTSGSITDISGPVSSTPRYLAKDAFGNIWFSDLGLNTLGKLVGSLITETNPIPTANAIPDGITVGPGGTIWFTEFKADKIGVFTPS
jgi:streptogramin lyase